MEELELKLTPKQRRFADLYLANGWNGTKAARAAGYGNSDEAAAVAACRLLKNEHVRGYLARRSREIYDELNLTPERLAAEFVRLYRRATQGERVKVWDSEEKAYVDSGEWQYDAQTAVKILDRLGEHAGMFIHKAEVTTVQKGPLEGLSTDELRALIAMGRNEGARDGLPPPAAAGTSLQREARDGARRTGEGAGPYGDEERGEEEPTDGRGPSAPAGPLDDSGAAGPPDDRKTKGEVDA